MMIEFVKSQCEKLNIDMPKISYDTSIFKTKTTLACVVDETLHVSKENKPDTYFAIAHELRHLWQIKNDPQYYFKNYKSSDMLDITDYNLQIAEIDANAWASIVLIGEFGLKPLYFGMDSKVKDAIKARIDFIVENDLF